MCGKLYMRGTLAGLHEQGDMMALLFTTTIELPELGLVTVETQDFSQSGYEMTGFESVTTLADGDSWGIGPDNGESPHELHNIAVNAVCEFLTEGQVG